MTLNRTGAAELLTPDTVLGYLAARGVLETDEPAHVRPLGGGVSNVVLAITSGARSLVVKQARGRLAVAEEWLADPGRAVTEARALRLAGQLTPGVVPGVVDVDADRCAVVITHAPGGWTPWKESLLAGVTDDALAARLGHVLGTWHAETDGRADVAERFDEADAFRQLRVEPYYEATARADPDHATDVWRHAEQMVDSPRCLVHGDFSPKNVLVGADGLWIIDFEVAHHGDPAFDVAFLLSHLMLKAIHRPDRLPAYRRCTEAFTEAYAARWGREITWPYVVGHVGCLLLARVKGKSPVEYLDAVGRAHATRVAGALLAAPHGLDEAWTVVARHVADDGVDDGG